MAHTLRLSSHDELICYVPHVLGFAPESSMVCLAFGGGPTSRMDLPDSPESMGNFLQELEGVYLHRHRPQRMALLAFGEDYNQCLEALSTLGARLVDSEHGLDVGPVLWVDGDEWFDVLDGRSGRIDPGTRTRIDAEFALMGRVMPADRREDLATALRGDPTPVADHLVAAQEREQAMDLSARMTEIEWFGSRLDEFLQDRKPLSDVEAARALAVIHDSTAVSAAGVRMTRANAAVSTEFWHDLVRRAPDEVRDMPAALLALSSYLDGQGAHAWAALSQISEARPPLADLVATVLERAVNPRDLERALHHTAPGALMQQAALRDAPAKEHRDRENRLSAPGIDGPPSAAPGR